MATTFLISRLKRIYIRAYDNIFAYFKENSELIATDLRKVQALDAATKMIWQIHFKGNFLHQNFLDPPHLRHSCQNVTHNTHALTHARTHATHATHAS